MAADAKRVDAPASGISNIATILDLLGGQKSSQTTTSDTSALKGILGNLQGGQDYDALLKSIFTQAGGQIPGLTAGLANSLGARTGNNSAVSTALGKLLETTALKGQQQTAQLQQNNQQLQVQAAAAIANGNKTTTGTSGLNQGKAAQNLAILGAGSKLLDSGIGKTVTGKAKSLWDSATGETPADLPQQFDTSPSDFAQLDQVSAPADFAGGGSDVADFGNMDFSNFLDSSIVDSGTDAFVNAAADNVADAPYEDIAAMFGFADGGLVGRDEKKVDYPSSKTTQPSNMAGSPQAYADGGEVQIRREDIHTNRTNYITDQIDRENTARKNYESARGTPDESYRLANLKEEYARTARALKQPDAGAGKGNGYADGGRVEPKVGTKAPVKSGGTGGGLSKDSVESTTKDANLGTITLKLDTSQMRAQGGVPKIEKGLKDAGAYADGGIIQSAGGRRSSAPSYTPDDIYKTAAIQSPLEALNPLQQRRNATGDTADGNGGGGSGVGVSSAVPNAPTAQSATVGNTIGAMIGKVITNLALGPVPGLVANAVASSGTAANNAQQGLTPSVTVGPISFDTAADASDSPDPDGSSAGGVGTSAGNEGDADGGNGSPDSGGTTSGDSGGDGYSNGGKIAGKGTGTSDSITAKVSTGEYIVPADVVQSLGVRFFDELKNHFHTPAEIQNAS